jgi:hypothetical protein
MMTLNVSPPPLPQLAKMLTEPDTRNDKWELTISFQLGKGRRGQAILYEYYMMFFLYVNVRNSIKAKVRAADFAKAWS